jgi:hypothetical protein
MDYARWVPNKAKARKNIGGCNGDLRKCIDNPFIIYVIIFYKALESIFV